MILLTFNKEKVKKVKCILILNVICFSDRVIVKYEAKVII